MLGGNYWSIFKNYGLATYNAKRLTLTIGSQLVSGYADEVCTIEYTSDNITPVKGIGGNTALLRQVNKDAVITFSLLQMSETNKWLMAMQQDMLDDSKPIQLPNVVFSDYNLGIAWTATSAYIQKHPTLNYASTAGVTQWSLYCIQCTPRQNIKLDDSALSNEEILFRKVRETTQSLGKTIKSVFS